MGILARAIDLRGEKRSAADLLKSMAPSLYASLNPTSLAGPAVNETTAMKSNAVSACVRVITETLCSLPLMTMERTDAGRRRATEKRVYGLLHDQFNPLMSADVGIQTLEAHRCLWGNCFAEIEWAGEEPAALWPIPPWRVPTDQITMVNGDLVYRVQGRDGGPDVFLPSRNMLHIPDMAMDGFVGMSPIRYAAESIGISMACETFTARFFSNGAQVHGLLEHPGVLTQDAHDRLRESVHARQGGLDNAFRVMILEEGMKWQDTSMKLVDAQLLELRRFQVADAARIYRVPLSMINETTGATSWGTGLAEFKLAFIAFCMRPRATRWEKMIGLKLHRDPRYYSEFLFADLERGDLTTRYNAYAIARQWGWLSADEIRELENLNPIGGPTGQDYLNPLNFGLMTGQPQGTQAAARDFHPLLEAAWMRIGRRAADEVGAALSRSWDESTARDWMTGWLEKHRGYVEDQLGPIVAAGAVLPYGGNGR